MKNMKVSMKLIVSFLIVTVLAIVIGVVGIFSLTTAADNTATLAQDTTVAIASARMNRNIQNQRAAFRGAAVYHVMGMLEQRDSNLAELHTLQTDFDGFHEIVASMFTTEDGVRLIGDIDTAFAPFSVERDAFEAAITDPNTTNEEMIAQLDKVAATVAPLANSITVLVDELANITTGIAADADTTATTTTFILIAVLVVAVIIAMFLAFYISGLISKPLVVLTAFMAKAGGTGDITLTQTDFEIIEKFGKVKDETGQCIASTASFVTHVNNVSNALETVANGDLTAELALLSESDVMGKSLQKMNANLNSMFGEIRNATAQVSTGSTQIADGAQALAQGSTEQSATVEELSAAIAEIATKTRANADMADDAAKLAGTIMNNAEKGSRQMDEMTNAVSDINQASQSISRVIKVIDDIAFQTNILALNAAVEAARAGQHGKGFAVVADEVRNLAAKSAEAAKNTGELISNSMEKAELGAKIAADTAASLVEIVSGINESNQIVGKIAASSEEQNVGIRQINDGIDQVAQVVQQNSATAEQSAAASEELSSQATMLEQLIAQFKLKEASSGLRAAAPRGQAAAAHASAVRAQQRRYREVLTGSSSVFSRPEVIASGLDFHLIFTLTIPYNETTIVLYGIRIILHALQVPK